MAELDGCEYHAALVALERAQETDDLHRTIQAMDTRRIAAAGCRKANPMLDTCSNPCEMQTRTLERAQTGQKPLTRSVAAGRPTKVIKSADELRDGELSPCHAANTSKELRRVQEAVYKRSLHGIDPATMRQYNSAKEKETIANNSCRKCNPYLTQCTNENCAIPTAEAQRQKGYAR